VRKWLKVNADKDGVFKHSALRGGYLRLEVESPEDQVMILHGGGYLYASVNGEPRAGDPYGTGWLLTPVLMKKGKNEVLIQNRSDSVKPELKAPPGDVFLTGVDMTLPDVIPGREPAVRAGLRVINASTIPRDGLSFVARTPGNGIMTTMIPALPPLSQTKLPCDILVPSRLDGEAKSIDVSVEIWGEQNKVVTPKPLAVKLEVRKPEDKQRRTFVSDIDGSVQYYSVVPATPQAGEKPGLTLTLHGAGVEAQGQAACFASKPWTHVVAATNRRPFGFDWEDWGRLDALEVLKDAEASLKSDPRRRWLTGHSMGGHGTWHLGVTFPDKFAAIGPSAGWVSMFSYAGMRRDDSADPIAALLRRATSPSDTLALINNLKPDGVFILHGDQDDTVPVGQARTMRQELAKFHSDWVYYKRPGAGHWWGNDCVDWKPMFQFFDQRTIPEPKDVHHVEFVTASPGVSASCFWATIEAQTKPYELSTIKIELDPAKRAFTGKTTNVARLALDLRHLPPNKLVSVELDGTKLADLAWPSEQILWFESEQGKWRTSPKPSAGLKSPHRNGSFKDAFRNHVLFVYGTKGTPEENAWALTKARYDAETFWYRGNGSIEVVADTAFDPKKEPDRNVVLYGHADSNAAWAALLGDAPVQAKRGSIKVGDREVKGDDIACVFVRPRPGSDVATVGAVTGTGIRGLRTTNRLPYFLSGVGFSDLLILDSSALLKGNAAIRAAGYFGNDWSVEKGDFAWR
jgi:pimeloyl-ACP methyl ester carboxylesterase